MRKLLALGSLVGVSLPLMAAAQPPPPPPPGGGGGGGYAAEPAAGPKMRFDVGLIAGLPQQDIDDADTSPGINLQFGYMFTPNLGLLLGIRYFQIQIEDSAGVDFSNYDADVGVRYQMPISPTAKVFGEAMLIFSTLEVSVDGAGSVDGSGIGFGVRGGGAFNVSGNISLGAALSYTTASIEIEDSDGDVGWLGLEGFVSFGF